MSKKQRMNEALGLVHLVDIDNENPIEDIEVDPQKIYTINANEPSKELSAYRYIFAITGGSYSQRKSARKELEARIMGYPTQHGIIPSDIRTTRALAGLVLGEKGIDAHDSQFGQFSDTVGKAEVLVVRCCEESPIAFHLHLVTAISDPKWKYNIEDHVTDARGSMVPSFSEALGIPSIALDTSKALLDTLGDALIAGMKDQGELGQRIANGIHRARHPFSSPHTRDPQPSLVRELGVSHQGPASR